MRYLITDLVLLKFGIETPGCRLLGKLSIFKQISKPIQSSQFMLKRQVAISTHHLLEPYCNNKIAYVCLGNNEIKFDYHFHIGCCFYKLQLSQRLWTDLQLKIQTSYFVITRGYIDLMLLAQKNYFDLSNFSLFIFWYSPVSLLWK